MRLALLLLLVAGCAKKAADAPAATEPAAEPVVGGASATTGAAPVAQAPPADEKREGDAAAAPPKGGARGQGAAQGAGSAIDEARASGVLGPTDPHAFAIKSNVLIKRASTKQLDAAAKTNLDAVKACYDKALEYKDTLTGELTMTVNAGKATVAKSTLKNPELEKCVVEALTALPAGGKATLVLAFKRE